MSTFQPASATARSTKGSITTIGLCLAIALLEGLDLQSAGVAAPRIAKEFSLSVAQMGWAFSAGASACCQARRWAGAWPTDWAASAC